MKHFLPKNVALQFRARPSNVFDSWNPVVIRCKQVDEGYPEVNLNIVGSSK
jgi:hypothetical protein